MAFEFKLPDIGEGVVEGEIVRWLVRPGEPVAEDQPMVEVMTDKATVEIPSPVEGTVLECCGDEGDLIDVGEVLVVIQREGEEAAADEKKPSTGGAAAEAGLLETEPTGEEAQPKVLATPAVRKLARSKGVELDEISGSGPGGRITAADVEEFARKGHQEKVEPADSRLTGGTLAYRGLRRKIGEHLVLSKRTAVHYTYIEEVDASALVKLRRDYVNSREGDRLTYLPFILKAVVSGLKRYPLLNSVLDEEKGEIRLLKRYDIGIATATSEGLLVPVVRNVDSLRVLDIANEVDRLARGARDGQLGAHELKGSTFTVTSLGPLGGIAATPVINYPEVAILSVHKISPRPVVRDGEIVIREMMNLSLTCDHRVVDGAVAAEFLHHVIGLVERPGSLVLRD